MTRKFKKYHVLNTDTGSYMTDGNGYRVEVTEQGIWKYNLKGNSNYRAVPIIKPDPERSRNTFQGGVNIND